MASDADPHMKEKVKNALAVQLAAINGDLDGLALLLAEADVLQLRRWCAYLALTQAEMVTKTMPGYRETLLEVAIEANR